MAIMNEGAAGEAIPPHYHEHVTETFFCITGALKMMVDGEYVTLYPGDYVHVPPKAVHSYQIVRNDTRFLGYLSPGFFDSFFRYLGVPYEGYIYPPRAPSLRFQPGSPAPRGTGPEADGEARRTAGARQRLTALAPALGGPRR